MHQIFPKALFQSLWTDKEQAPDQLRLLRALWRQHHTSHSFFLFPWLNQEKRKVYLAIVNAVPYFHECHISRVKFHCLKNFSSLNLASRDARYLKDTEARHELHLFGISEF